LSSGIHSLSANRIYYVSAVFTAVSQVNLGEPALPSVHHPVVLEERIFGDNWHRFLQDGCPSCHPTNDVRAL